MRSIEYFEINGGIVLSFDDAFKDIYYNVRSTLNKYNINVFIMFLRYELIGREGYLNISQVKELVKDSNCDICSHLSNYEICGFCSNESLESSILKSKEFLSISFGVDNAYMVFPYGSMKKCQYCKLAF